ncbi:MAG: HTH-type transcriptional repressor YvoA [Firmicutes bacterium ADurb.Bin506]|jgi:GntR family transcriptional regulator|nr:MAG: HTH-type transcriptional repressor YvoA [Firmicutes bacterium ADurb.Bin506]
MIPVSGSMVLNRDLPVPLYQQVYNIWKRRIESGDLKPGDRLPTERELCDAYDVSQITVRQAIQMLVNDGLVVRRPRTGTHVAHRKFNQDLIRLTSFSEDMRSRGLRPGGRVLAVAEEPADALVADKLRLAPKEPVIRIERLRTAEDEPMAIEVFRIQSSLCPGLAQRDMEGASLYDVLTKGYGLDLAWADQSLEAGLAGQREAAALGIRRGAPVLRVERLTYNSSRNPLEYTTSVYRADRYKLNVSMKR